MDLPDLDGLLHQLLQVPVEIPVPLDHKAALMLQLGLHTLGLIFRAHLVHPHHLLVDQGQDGLLGAVKMKLGELSLHKLVKAAVVKQQHIILGSKIVIEIPVGHPRLPTDIGDGDGVIPPLHNKPYRTLGDPVLCLRRLLLPLCPLCPGFLFLSYRLPPALVKSHKMIKNYQVLLDKPSLIL